MEEVGVSVAAKLAEYMVDPTLQQLQYLFCVRKITTNVELRKEELIRKKGRVQELVQEAINRTERIDAEVDKWKDDVESLMAEVQTLEEQLRANNGCLRGWCPTWTRYRLCRKLAKTTHRMIHLTAKSDHFNPFSHHVIAPDVVSRTSQNFKFFSSTQMAFDQLLQALQYDGISIIGLWGMGGSGKTTLVTEVKKKAEDLKLFNRVVLTTISQSPNTRNIQGEIADSLGLKLEEESEMGRAKRIALRLQSEEQILIILDDVWAMLNLEGIGIPFGGNHHRSYKVVLTTRRQEVCTLMECQKIIQLDLLKQDEAWTLFQTHAKVSDATKDLAREIAIECKGLPIAIVAVGTCLKGKGIDQMKVMLYRLRNAKPIKVDKGVRDVFACLELSYDYLATPEAKQLLLMCAMFPEDYPIAIEDLFRYEVGLGLCRYCDSFETERSQVRTTINDLIDSSLLMHPSPEVNMNEKEYVKLHDMVRDFALWKASEEDRTIMVNSTKELNEFIVDEAIKDCYVVSSWYDNTEIFQFPSQLDAPKLEFLLLRSRESLDISHASFEGLKELKALLIQCTSYKIELQPQSIQLLSNLRSLRLQHWDLRDISFVVSLTRLEILDLRQSKFGRVPNGIKRLNKLKLLDLSGCVIDECCYKEIGYCSQLEELYVPRHFPHSKNQNCYEYLVGTIGLMKLTRYNLQLGETGGRNEFYHATVTRSLYVGQLNMSMLGEVIRDLLQRVNAIQFYELEGGSKSFMPNIVQAVGGMNELTKLSLAKCREIECIIDETTSRDNAVVPRLDELVLRDMDNLKQLHRGPSHVSLFQKLERLSIFSCPQLIHIFLVDCNLGNLKFLNISHCPMLTWLFPISIACILLSLEKLEIEHCGELKHVFGENIGEEQPMHDQDVTQIVLPLLKYLNLKDLPNLVRLCPQRYHPRCPSIQEIQLRNCPHMELQELKEHEARDEEYKPLEAIERIGIDNCGVESIFHYPIGLEEQIPTFRYLQQLTLNKCARLKFVFSAHICQSLPELTFLTISCCEELEAVFLQNDEDTQKNLSINDSCLLKLKDMAISECNKLKFILYFMMSATTTSMLPQLSTLRISDCSEMEEIFKCSNIEDQDINNESEITFPNMKDMRIHNLPRLVSICQGYKLQTGEFCGVVEVYDCLKLIPIQRVTVDWSKDGLHREYALKYRQLNNNEALNVPLFVLNVGELDAQSPNVEHWWEVIGDDKEEEGETEGVGVVPTQVLSFQYLHSLKVTDIKKMKFVFSKSTILHNSLPKLTFLTLWDCEELEVIFGDSGEEDATYGDTNIVFSSLRKIELKNLPNLKSVRDQRLQFQVEVRDIINIWNCPKFVESSMGGPLQQLGTISQLSQVYSAQDSNIEMASSSNVNEEKGTMLISRADALWLEDLNNLISIWEGPTFILFQNLTLLRVSKCRRLKCMFRSSVMRSLPCLEYLRISECEELEEIMMSSEEEEELHHHFPNESSSSSFCCFPKLEDITVVRCRKLKCIFPSSLPSARLLPQLKWLTIEDCSEVKGVYDCEHDEERFINNNMLPKLIFLIIEDCPNFSKTTLAALESLERQNKNNFR